MRKRLQSLFWVAAVAMLAAVCLAAPAWAAIALQTANVSTAEGTADFSWNHTGQQGQTPIGEIRAWGLTPFMLRC